MTDEDYCDVVNETDKEIEYFRNQLSVALGVPLDQIGDHPLHVYEYQQRLLHYDLLVTTIRSILTAAGIPDHEDYPDEDVDEREKSLRTGGRMIPLDKRVQMLADMNSLAKIISRKDPKIIKQFLEDLAWELEEVYPNYETGYAPIFLGKAAWELGTMKDEVIDE